MSCNGGSTQDSIALTLCQETSLQQKEREKGRGDGEKFSFSPQTLNTEERKEKKNPKKTEEKQRKGKERGRERLSGFEYMTEKCKFCLQRYSIFLTFGQLNLRTS